MTHTRFRIMAASVQLVEIEIYTSFTHKNVNASPISICICVIKDKKKSNENFLVQRIRASKNSQNPNASMTFLKPDAWMMMASLIPAHSFRPYQPLIHPSHTMMIPFVSSTFIHPMPEAAIPSIHGPHTTPSSHQLYLSSNNPPSIPILATHTDSLYKITFTPLHFSFYTYMYIYMYKPLNAIFS